MFSNGGAISVNGETAERIKRLEFWKDVFRTIFFSLGILAAVLSILLNIYLSTKILDVAKDTRNAANNTRVSSDLLVNCTTPNHPCYERGRSATSGAVGTITKAAVAAAYCAVHLGPIATYPQIQTCTLAIVS